MLEEEPVKASWGLTMPSASAAISARIAVTSERKRPHMKSAIMPTRVRIDSVCGSVIRICAEVARRASSRSYRAETPEHGFRHSPYRKNSTEPGRANMLPRARPANNLNLPPPHRIAEKRHERLLAHPPHICQR